MNFGITGIMYDTNELALKGRNIRAGCQSIKIDPPVDMCSLASKGYLSHLNERM